MNKLMKTLLPITMIIFYLILFSISTFAITNPKISTDGNGAGSQLRVEGNDKYDIDTGKSNDLKQVDDKLSTYATSITFVGGIATITMVIIFMKHCIRLGVLGTEHWALKRNSIMALLWTGLAAALLGSATLWFAIAYNIFN